MEVACGRLAACACVSRHAFAAVHTRGTAGARGFTGLQTRRSGGGETRRRGSLTVTRTGSGDSHPLARGGLRPLLHANPTRQFKPLTGRKLSGAPLQGKPHPRGDGSATAAPIAADRLAARRRSNLKDTRHFKSRIHAHSNQRTFDVVFCCSGTTLPAAAGAAAAALRAAPDARPR
jgi:hypothetical protein